MSNSNELRRSTDNKMLAGVCGGIGEHLNIDPTIVRILWVLFSLFYFTGLIAYIILVLVIPEGPPMASVMHQDDVDTSRVHSGEDSFSTSHGTSICPYCDGQIKTGDITCGNCGASL